MPMRKIASILLIATNVWAAEPACSEVERTCDRVIEAQDQHVERLQQQVRECLEEQAAFEPPTPAWIWILVGAAAGAGGVVYLNRR